MMERARALRLGFFVALVALAACSGSGAGSSAPPAATASLAPAGGASRPTTATLRIVIPAKTTASAARRPAYVSPATQSIAIAFTPVGGGAVQTFNQNLTSASNPNCTASLVSPLVCSVVLPVNAGSYTATFTTYDGLLDGSGNPTGNVLSANQSVPVTIASGQSNAVNVTLQGVPASLGVLATASGGTSIAGGALTINRCFTSQSLSVVAFDADQNIIVGPGAPTPALTTTSSLVTISSPSAASPNVFVVTPNGTPGVGSTLALVASATPLAGSGASSLSTTVNANFTVDYCGTGIWIAAWAQAASHNSAFPGTAGNEQTFRETIKPTVGSRGTIRLHFSNAVGIAPIVLGAVHVAVQGTGVGVQVGTDQVVTFGGSGGTTIPVGATATSDPLPMAFPYGTILSVTEYVAGSWTWLPQHIPGVTLVTSYQTPAGTGNATADLAGTSFTQTTNAINVVDRVDVYGNYKETVAILGSSTGDGFGSVPNVYNSLEYDLVTALHTAGRDDTSVVNMSIIPNAMLDINQTTGDASGTARFQRDIVGLPGIGTFIQMLGDVDLKGGTCSAAATIIPGEQHLIAMATAANIRTILPTVAPATYCNASNFGTMFPPDTGADAERLLLNSWILSTAPITIEGTLFQPPAGVVLTPDFSAVTTDTSVGGNPGYMNPNYRFDYSHANANGQAAQAATIPVGAL